MPNKIKINSLTINENENVRTVKTQTYTTDNLTSVEEHLDAYGLWNSKPETTGEDFYEYNENTGILKVNLYTQKYFDNNNGVKAEALEHYNTVLNSIKMFLNEGGY